MNLDVVVTKLKALAGKVESEKGSLEFLGLFLREHRYLWDLIISAPWLEAGEGSSYEYVFIKLKEELTTEDRTCVARMVILEHGDAVLTHFLTRYEPSPEPVDVHYETETGLIIRRVYIIVARPGLDQPAQQTTKKPRRGKASVPNPS